MANVFDYLDWRGDLTLGLVPLCDVDALVLSRLSYLPLDGLVPPEGAPVGALMRQLLASKPPLLLPEDGRFIPALAASQRFCEMRIMDYVNQIDLESQTQFAAITVYLDDDHACAVFRGTDATLVGWKEDFNMGFLPIVPSQREAADYLRAAAAAFPSQKLRAGGHSKGGNLAVYAAVWCGESVQDQLLAVYNNDGPGFHTSLLDRPEHQRIANRIQTILPESSVVGMLLEHEESYQVVRSNQVGLMQHDGFSWQVLGTQFIHLSGLTEGGRIVDSALRDFVRGLDQEQRIRFVDALFEVLTCTNAETLTDLKDGGFRTAYSMLKTVRSLDPDTRQALSGTLGLLVRSGAKSVSQSQPIQRLKNWRLVDWISKKLAHGDET